MKSIVLIAAIALGLACASRPDDRRSATPARADSLVLERTPCFGFCPAYRLRLAAGGSVHFRSTGSDGREGRDSIAPASFDSLVTLAVMGDLVGLPDTVARDATLCRLRATDHPTIVVRLFGPVGAKEVVYYTGCFMNPSSESVDHVAPALRRLDSLAAAIDRVARSARWVAPASRRSGG